MTATTGTPGAEASVSQNVDIKGHIETIFKFLAAGIGLAYATGYLVVLTFLNGYGIRETGAELFKLRYIYVGSLCLACPTVMVCVIYGLLSGQPTILADSPASTIKNFISRLFPAAENMPWALVVMIVNLLVVFYCIIAFAHPGLFGAKQGLINWLYVPLFATLLLRIVVGEKGLWSRGLNRVRWVLVSVALVASVLILKDIDFVSMLKERTYNYVVLQALFFFFTFRFTRWSRLGSNARSRTARLVVRITILGPLFVLGVFSFAHTVYNHIPAEKGGGDFSQSPDSQICFSDAYRTSIPLGLVADLDRTPVCSVPVKVIEETTTDVYVARSSDRGNRSEQDVPNPASLWRSGAYHPAVFEVSHGAISSIVILNQATIQISMPTPVVPQAAPAGEGGPASAGKTPRSSKKSTSH